MSNNDIQHDKSPHVLSPNETQYFNATGKASAVTKTLDRLRQEDPFYFFSIPGALEYDSVPSKKSAALLASSLKNNKITRKTRVSCEVHSDLYLFEMLADTIVTTNKLDVALNGDLKEIPQKHYRTASNENAGLYGHKQVAANSA